MHWQMPVAVLITTEAPLGNVAQVDREDVAPGAAAHQVSAENKRFVAGLPEALSLVRCVSAHLERSWLRNNGDRNQRKCVASIADRRSAAGRAGSDCGGVVREADVLRRLLKVVEYAERRLKTEHRSDKDEVPVVRR